MPRTSLILPDPLQQRLRIEAKNEGKKVAELIREILDRDLKDKEAGRTRRMYRHLRQLEGIGPKGITDASTTINDVLYGDNEPRKGQDE